MTKLEQIRQLAQRDANRCGPLAILNLNRFNALYVIREVPHSDCSEFVELVMPEHTPDEYCRCGDKVDHVEACEWRTLGDAANAVVQRVKP